MQPRVDALHHQLLIICATPVRVLLVSLSCSWQAILIATTLRLCVPRLDVWAYAEPVVVCDLNIRHAMRQVGSDPFTEMRQAKRERLKKNEKQQMGNLKVAMKQSGPRALPGTVKLAASLPQHGNGRPSKRKDTEDDVRRPTWCPLLASAAAEGV